LKFDERIKVIVIMISEIKKNKNPSNEITTPIHQTHGQAIKQPMPKNIAVIPIEIETAPEINPN
jgi:hypothetical protein